MKSCHAVHHTVVNIASLVMQIHRLQKIVVRLQCKNIELSGTSRIFVNYKVSSLGVDSFLMGVIVLLVNLNKNKHKVEDDFIA